MDSKFPLQKVLEHRNRVYDIKVQELERLRSELNNLETEKKLLMAEIERIDNEMATLSQDKLLFKPMYDKYRQRVVVAVEDVKRRIDEKINEIEEKKKEVIEALNNKKIMEKLKEKHIINYRNFLKKEELKLIDELVITRFKK